MGRLVKEAGGRGRLIPAAVLSARDQAARLLAEAEAARDGAERRGFEAGYAAGREAGLAEVTATLVQAQAHAEALRARAAEPAALLARRMAEKIVGRALELDPALIAEIAAQALAASRSRAGAVVLRVHPDDLPAVEEARPRFADRLGAALQLRVVADASVGRAGCVVETPVGRLDARLASQLDALEGAVRGKG
jgi:flagellar assembly protein FliH